MTATPSRIAPCPSCGSTEVVAQAICMNCGQYRPELEATTGAPPAAAPPAATPPAAAPPTASVPAAPRRAADPEEVAPEEANSGTTVGDPPQQPSEAAQVQTNDLATSDASIQPDDAATQEAGSPPQPQRITAADLADPSPAPEPVDAGQYLSQCQQCGGAIDSGYCEQCGSPATKVRDHFTAEPADWVGGVCDRGIRHSRNEDAMAIAATVETLVRGGSAQLVVCDGVSTSDDSDVASLAAAHAALTSLQDGEDTDAGKALTESVAVANRAVVESTDPTSTKAASCTFVAALVEPGRYVVANIGDSRAYWLSDRGVSEQLSVDDSVAQLRIDSGVERSIAENGPGAHAITKWLGSDAPDLTPTLTHREVSEPGWLMLCSDGLWNYASEPGELEDLFAAALVDNQLRVPSPIELAQQLTSWACAQGGKDNITVVLARLEPRISDPEAAQTTPVADILAGTPHSSVSPDSTSTSTSTSTSASTDTTE